MSTTNDTRRIDWYAHACKVLNTNASREAIDHAIASAMDASVSMEHPAASIVAGTRAGIADMLSYLQGFARAASHDDLVAEINLLVRETTTQSGPRRLRPGTRVRYTGAPTRLVPLNGERIGGSLLGGAVARPGDVGVTDDLADAGVRVRFENGFGQCLVRDLEVIEDA